jgi:pimeloyl-ACP methyl ester carboxylesterase
MRIECNGARLWFDVDGPSLVPDGPRMRARPTVILLHGGPAVYDHSYLKPAFAALTEVAQIVYLDLRDHGRSSRHDPSSWSLEACADDVRAFSDALGLVAPIVLGHSLGASVAVLYGARHPGHAGGLILLSGMARFDLDRVTEGFRATAGDEVAELARREFTGSSLSEAEFARVYAARGPHALGPDELARRTGNPDLVEPGLAVLTGLDTTDEVPRIASPTLVAVGALDPITPVAAAMELMDLLPVGLGRLEIIEGAGHFPWLDRPERLWPVLTDAVARMSTVH